jgi:hypothetical protein
MGRKVVTIVVGLFLLSMAAIPGEANASSADRAQTELSSLPAIEAYLTSIGVDPGSVVVQQGRFNYAGADCPGAEWNCTAATKVVQISTSTSPGANIFDCLPAVNASIPGLNECLIVQSSVLNLADPPPPNSASCSAEILDGPGKSKCKIKQQSKKGNNYAEVRARITQRDGSSQSALEEAEIEQTSDSGNNTAKITQTIQQTLKVDPPTAVSQDQQARQKATVTQTASSSGSNSSTVAQSQSQDENASGGAAITQNQNAASTEKNQELTVTQTTSTGNNTSSFSQLINQYQQAQSAPGPIMQTQGTPVTGGQMTTVKQEILTFNTGHNSNTTNLDEQQTQVKSTQGTFTQNHFGPQDCCGTQINGTAENNFNKVVERNVQHNDTGGASQSSEQNAHCSDTVGECSVDQTYTSNSGTDHHTDSGSSVFSDRACVDTGEGASCTDID